MNNEYILKKIYFEVTNKCNLRCNHCFISAGEGYSKELGFEEIVKLTDDLKELGVENITISGGEPLVRNDIFDILDKCIQQQMVIKLATNGILIDKGIAKKLSGYGIPCFII